MFHLHPTVNSTFSLNHVEIHSTKATSTPGDSNHRHGHHGATAMAIWSAKTPTNMFPQSSDTFLFDCDASKIMKQYFTCRIDHLNTPWYVDDN